MEKLSSFTYESMEARESPTVQRIRSWLENCRARPWLLFPEFVPDVPHATLRVTAYPAASLRWWGRTPRSTAHWRGELDEPLLIIGDELTTEEAAWLHESVDALTGLFPLGADDGLLLMVQLFLLHADITHARTGLPSILHHTIWIPILDPTDPDASLAPVSPDIPRFGFKSLRVFWEGIRRHAAPEAFFSPSEWDLGPPTFKVLPPLSRMHVPADVPEIRRWLASDGPPHFVETGSTGDERYKMRRGLAETAALSQYFSPTVVESHFPPIWACFEEANLAQAIDEYDAGLSTGMPEKTDDGNDPAARQAADRLEGETPDEGAQADNEALVFRRIVNAGAKYFARWLALLPERLYGSRPTFSTEHGTVSVDYGAIQEQGRPDVVVTIYGNFVPSESQADVPERDFSVISFGLLPLSAERLELTGRCLDRRVEPFFLDLMKEIGRLWPDPPERSAHGGQLSAEEIEAGHTIARVKEIRFLPRPPADSIDWLFTFMNEVRRRDFHPTPETPLPTGNPFRSGEDDPVPSVVKEIHVGAPVALADERRRPFQPQVFVSYVVYDLYAESFSKRAFPTGLEHGGIRFTISPSPVGGTKLELECLEPAFAGVVDELLREIDASARGTAGETPARRRDDDLPSNEHNRAGEAGPTSSSPPPVSEHTLQDLRPADRERYRAAWRLITPLRRLRWSNTRIAAHLKEQNPQLRITNRETIANVIRYGDAGLLD